MKKVQIALLIIAGGLLVAIYIAVNNDSRVSITSLQRPDETESEADYRLSVLYGGEEAGIEVSLNTKQLTREELDEYFEQALEQVKAELIGENSSLTEVYKDLELVTEIAEYEMRVQWHIDDISLVNYWGNVSDVEEPVETELIAVIRYMGASDFDETVTVREFYIPVVVVPKEEIMQSFEEGIKALIMEADKQYRYENNVVLPNEFNGMAVEFEIENKSDTWMYLCLLLIVVLCLFFKQYSDKDEQKRKRAELLQKDYPELIMKLSLLIGAGMTPYNAFCKIGSDYSNQKPKVCCPVYEEVMYMINSIKTGVNEVSAYIEFGRRTGLQCYIKLATLLQQNIVKGNENLRTTLAFEVTEAMEERKARARKAGEQAGTKLLLPMLMMLGIVFVVIMVPAFMMF